MIDEVPEVPAGAAPCLPRELLSSAAFLLGRLGISVKLQVFQEFERAGYSPYHYSVLALLDEGARETQSTIADTLNFDRSTLVGLLDTLEGGGFIERRPDPNDRRRNVVTLTAAGRRQLGEFRTLAQRVEDEILGPLDEQTRAELHATLLRLAAHRDRRYAAEPLTG